MACPFVRNDAISDCIKSTPESIPSRVRISLCRKSTGKARSKSAKTRTKAGEKRSESAPRNRLRAGRRHSSCATPPRFAPTWRDNLPSHQIRCRLHNLRLQEASLRKHLFRMTKNFADGSATIAQELSRVKRKASSALDRHIVGGRGSRPVRCAKGLLYTCNGFIAAIATPTRPMPNTAKRGISASILALSRAMAALISDLTASR